LRIIVSSPLPFPGALRGRGGRVRPDDHGVGDRDDLVHRQVGEAGVLADRLGARGLVDADRAHAAGALREHVAADPAHVVGHVLVPDARRAPGGLLELLAGLPAVAAQNGVQVHDAS
jgi:hypothetical protein